MGIAKKFTFYRISHRYRLINSCKIVITLKYTQGIINFDLMICMEYNHRARSWGHNLNSLGGVNINQSPNFKKNTDGKVGFFRNFFCTPSLNAYLEKLIKVKEGN